MPKHNIILVAITFLIVVATLIGAIALAPHQQTAEQSTPAQSFHRQPLAPANQPYSNDALFTFGDDNSHRILLELASVSSVDYTLQAAPANNTLSAAEVVLCTHTGQSVAAPPSKITALQAEPTAPTLPERVSAWLTSTVSDSYMITLWSPTGQADEYVLVSGDGPGAPVVCPSLLDEDV